MSQDRQLLAEFRRNGSETAFEHLVERHLKLVYSTTMRVVNGDAHLAQDIAQTVFANLARKVGALPANVALAGWLHRDARFTALEFLRKERRRATREREAATMHEIESSGDGVDWSQIRPILDETLGELEEEDRHALLLRFFEQRNLSDVGSTMGLSEDAARKRVSRASEKLRLLLSSRGVTAAAAALASVLESRGAEKIPPGLGAQFARSALAAAGTATASTTGILTLITSAKAATLIAAAAVLLLVGGAVVKLCAPVSEDRSVANDVPATGPGKTVDATVATALSPSTGVQLRSTANAKSDPAVVDALAKLRAALYDPAPDDHPDPRIREAIYELKLDDRRTGAVPLLREALHDASEQVNNRAAYGLGEIGPEARDAVPDLVEKLRSTDSGDNNLIRALQFISPTPEVGRDLVKMFADHPRTRPWIIDALSSAWAGSPEVAQAINETVRPMLQDKDPETQLASATALGAVLRSQAGPDAVKICIEALKSTNEDSHSFALGTLKNIGTDPTNLSGRVMLDRLGPGAEDAVPALIEIVNTTKRKDHRMAALELLNAIQPGVLAANPAADKLLQTHQQDFAFAMKINELEMRHQQMPLPDLIEGLQEHPGAAAAIARVLGEIGPDAKEALPLLIAALHGLAATSPADMFEANQARQTVANAIQKIAPDQPKVLFTYSDTHAVLNVFDDPAFKSDKFHRDALRTAMKLVWQVRGSALEMTPDQMHIFLDSLKTNDPAAYDAVAAKVAIIDPNFFNAPSRK